MGLYKINASIRDKQSREIAYRTPLWVGEAPDPKTAIVSAHEPLTPIVKGEPRADTVVLHVTGPDGSRMTATEYAEDFTIGYGASSIGSTGLLHDQIDVSLTDEQREQAEAYQKGRALDALMQDKSKTDDSAVDAVRDFFGGTLPSEKTAPQDRVHRAVPSKEYENYTRGGFVPGAASHSSAPITQHIRESIWRTRMNGIQVQKLKLHLNTVKALFAEHGISLPDGTIEQEVQFEGIPIEVQEDTSAPLIQIVKAPRQANINVHVNVKDWNKGIVETNEQLRKARNSFFDAYKAGLTDYGYVRPSYDTGRDLSPPPEFIKDINYGVKL